MIGKRQLLAVGVVAGLVAGAGAVGPGCLLPDFSLASGGPVDAGDLDATDAPAEPPCGKTYPDPPLSGSSTANTEITLAMRSLDLGEGAAAPPGYDLDGLCTCIDGGAPSCVTKPKVVCDTPGGVDNSMSKLVSLMGVTLGEATFGSEFFSAGAEEGSWSFLIRVREYNGEADDPSVEVALLPSPGTGGIVPKWDGNDVWRVSGDSVVGGDPTQPRYRSSGAYVRDHVLVAALPDMEIELSGSNQRFAFHVVSAVLTGTLTGAGALWQISDGIVAGRWAQRDMFVALASYRNSAGKGYCTDQTYTYGVAKGVFCAALDLLANPAGLKSQPCDAISLGFGFKAESAFVGQPLPSPAPTDAGCTVATDPAYDDCTK